MFFWESNLKNSEHPLKRIFRIFLLFLINLFYLSQLNRSDSDSAMPLYRRSSYMLTNPFQRNSVERRSLRWRRSSASMMAASGAGHGRNHSSAAACASAMPRTSLDLELDLRAQHSRLETLQDELVGLRQLKVQLEEARARGDSELAAWLLEDKHFQRLVSQV